MSQERRLHHRLDEQAVVRCSRHEILGPESQDQALAHPDRNSQGRENATVIVSIGIQPKSRDRYEAQCHCPQATRDQCARATLDREIEEEEDRKSFMGMPGPPRYRPKNRGPVVPRPRPA